MMIKRNVAGIVFILITVPCFAQTEKLNELDSFIHAAMKQWEVPGLALGVVENGEVIYEKGFGIRNLNQRDSVDSKTIFAIGSLTKSFTAAALGMLVEDKLIQWDDPVIDHLPQFRSRDIWLSHQVTISDLLSHQTGLENNNLLFWGSKLDSDELVDRFRHLDQSLKFRKGFLYNNMGYVVTSKIIPAKAGEDWDQFIGENIFKSLAMNASSTGYSNLSKHENIAAPHTIQHGEHTTIPHLELSNAGPAGSIYSNLNDMITWLQFWLNRGSYKGEQIVDSTIIEDILSPKILVESESIYTLPWPESNFNAYGFGWFLHEYGEYKLIEHGGNTDGMTALVAMLPERQTGIIILTNMGNTFLPYVLTYEIFNRLTGVDMQNFNKQLLTYKSQFEELVHQIETRNNREPNPERAMFLSLKEYAGTYENKLYGQAKIQSSTSGKLSIKLTDLGFEGVLNHISHNTFSILWNDYNLLLMMNFPHATLQLDSDGTPETLKLNNDTYFKTVHE